MKYKDEQGNWVSIALPSLDSMPVGTEVDFDGTSADIPVGWEEVNDYSTSEVNTGKTWIDGKPIYRRVFDTATPVNENAGTVATMNFVVDNMIKLEGFIYLTSYKNIVPIQYLASENYSYIYIQYNSSTTNIVMAVKNAEYYNKRILIVAEYTKTTD